MFKGELPSTKTLGKSEAAKLFHVNREARETAFVAPAAKDSAEKEMMNTTASANEIAFLLCLNINILLSV